MPTQQQQLENKLNQVTKKLKLLYQSYQKLKQQVKEKDELIIKLKLGLEIEINRNLDSDQVRENNRVKEIRKKYQIIQGKDIGKVKEGVVRNVGNNMNRFQYQDKNMVDSNRYRDGNIGISRFYAQNTQNKQLKYSKSLSPQQFNKSYQQNKYLTIKHQQNILTPIRPAPQKLTSFALPFQSQIKIADKNRKQFDISQIDNKYTQDFLQQKQKQREKQKQKQKERERQRSKQIQKQKQKWKQFEKQKPKQQQAQAQTQILKQLWQQRDRQIKRMDDLFESLNKRIYGV